MNNVYIARPIDQFGGASIEGLQDALDYLNGNERVSWIYQPANAFTVGHGERNPGLKAINDYAIDRADVLIAFLPLGAVSIGTPIEIDYALRTGKKVLVVSDAPSWSLMYGWGNLVTIGKWGPEAEEALERFFEPSLDPSEALGALGRLQMPITLSEGSEEPRRGHPDDAGLDLVVSEDVWVPPGCFTDIPCGVSVHLPEGTWGLITGRSSTLRKRGLLCAQGVIDAGYRGEMKAGVWNLTSQGVHISKGDRLAQLIILPNVTEAVDLQVVSELAPGTRGLNGFGSTGL